MEDQILREQVDAQQAHGAGKDWCQVALALPGRTNKDCRKRWHNSVAEGLRKGQWSRSEDQLLTRGVHHYGSQWTKVATCVNSRSADQCAKRWQQSLDPRLDRSDWREHEDADLLAAVERLGRHWKDIQEQYLPHRSKNCVKNRYSVLSRRNATQLTPYDDSVEGSSSDPGTPLQLEGNPSLAYTSSPPLYDTTQTSYGHAEYSYTGHGNMGPTWSGLSNPNEYWAAGYQNTTPVPTHPIVYPSQVLPSNTDGWSYLYTTMSTQQPSQHSAAPPMQCQTYTYPAQRQPQSSAAIAYMTSMAQANSQHVPVADSSRRASQQDYERHGSGGVPYGWPSH
jgi:hypothetical protein